MLQEQRWAPGQRVPSLCQPCRLFTANPLGLLPWVSRTSLGESDPLALCALLWQHLNQLITAGELGTTHQLEVEIHFVGWIKLVVDHKLENCKASSLSWSKLLYSARRSLSMEEVCQHLLLDVSPTVTHSIKCCFFPIHRVGSCHACSLNMRSLPRPH